MSRHRRSRAEEFCVKHEAGRASESDDNPSGQWFPAVDICETDQCYTLIAEVPGVDPGDLQISVAGSRLTIRGERHFDPFCAQETCHRMETMRGPFHRTFSLPENLDESEISARLADGILSVRVSRPSGARRIPIKNGDTTDTR